MTNLAGLFLLVAGWRLKAMSQRECMLAQKRRLPGIWDMAILAAQPEETGMDLWLGMALEALRGCACEYLLNVAGLALERSVGAEQGEEGRMVKIAHAVHPIMAIQTCSAKLLLVFQHKSGPLFLLRMARHAGLQVKRLRGLMAVPAGHLGPLGIYNMPRQVEAGIAIMIE